MTTLTKRNGNLLPTILSDFFDSERFFGHNAFEKQLSKWVPAVNITENDKEYKIEFSAPGLNKNDFKVGVEDGVLFVSSEKEEEKNVENERCTRREFCRSSFSRSFQLPDSVKTEEVKAKYEDGILLLTIPKKEEAKLKVKKDVKVN